MRPHLRSGFCCVSLFVCAISAATGISRGDDSLERPLKTKHVVLVMTDGVRWEEIFRGAEQMLMSRGAGGVKDVNLLALRRDFDRPTAQERREALFPFLWKTIVRQGQLFGNQDRGSVARVTNRKYFSYP